MDLRPVRVYGDIDCDGHFDISSNYCDPSHRGADFYYRDDVDPFVSALRARLAEAERLLSEHVGVGTPGGRNPVRPGCECVDCRTQIFLGLADNGSAPQGDGND